MNELYVCANFVTKDEVKNHKYCSTHCKNFCYSKQKNYFEKYVAEIRNPELLYIERNLSTDYITYVKPCGMNSRYKSCPKFINAWLNDVNNLNYDRLDFFPDKTKCPKSVYNIFNGYAIEKIYLPNQSKELLTPILKHFNDVFESPETVDYIIKHFANTIQYPQRKVGVSVIMQGNQGSGKSFIVDDMLVPIIGKSLYYYTCKPGDIAGDHAEGQENKLVVTIDEIHAKGSFDIANLLKSFITQTTITVNPKGIRPYIVNNFNIYYFTTNNKTPLKIEVGDRRYFATRMLDTYCKNAAYYKQLSKYMQRPDVLSAWFDHLKSIEVKDYDFINNRPESKIYNDIKDACTSNILKFLNDTIIRLGDEEDSKNVQVLRSNKLFANYIDWKSATNHKDEHNTTSFGREITGIQGIKKDRDSQGNKYIIDLKELKQYFQANSLFGNVKTDDVCEMDKLRNIITRQQAELTQLRQDMAVLKTVNVNININNNVVDNDNDNDNDHIDLITNSFFKQKSHNVDIDQKPQKVKKVKETPKIDLLTQDISDNKPKKVKKNTTKGDFKDIANEMLAF